VFPFFLFAVGTALAFVMPGLSALPPAEFAARVAKRGLLIFGIGLLLNAAPFVRYDAQGDLSWRSWEALRVMGVLQRIALAWVAAAVIVRWAGLQRLPAVVAALLLGYWGLCVGLGGAGDPYSLEGFFGTGLDRALLGSAHLYNGEGVPFDPEGLASTLPAVAQVLLGVWAGHRLARRPPDLQGVVDLFVAAMVLGALAYAWQLVMPVNKKIWTSSYVLLTTALALAVLATLVWWIDLRRKSSGWMRFCEVFGLNALFVYAMSGLIPRFQGLLRWTDATTGRPTTPMDWAWLHVFEPIAADPRFGSLLFALANLAGYWLLAAWLDRRRIYLKV